MSHLSRHRTAVDPVALVTSATPRPPLVRRIATTLAVWRERSAARRHLAVMDARSLRDVGISQAAATYEADKPFWCPFGTLR